MASTKDLKFTVSLIDKTQKGFKSVRSNMLSMQKTAQQTQKSWMSIGTGAAGLWGTGQSLGAIINPAREMDAARGELQSLLGEGSGKTLDIVQNQAMNFAEQYGSSATDFVRASYDIQSAIDGLSANNLAQFTNASAILATATKSDTATITSYMGTMYGIFESNAKKMGKGQWVEQIAGQTATAVKMFKTTGNAMNEAFSSLGARATNYNISSGEQFAVLGQLQSTLKGATAGTAYAGFLDAIPKAEKTLGISLSGADGKALGMVDIIDKLKEKLGSDLGTKQKGLLGQAFGTQAAGMLDLLWNKTDSLKANIQSLNQVSDMSKAEQMATAIADPYEQLAQAGNNVRIVFGQALSGSLMPLISYMTGGANTIRRWTTLFPHLTKSVGYLVIGIAGLTAIMSTLAIVTGVTSLAWTGLAVIWKATGLKALTRMLFLTNAATGKQGVIVRLVKSLWSLLTDQWLWANIKARVLLATIWLKTAAIKAQGLAVRIASGLWKGLTLTWNLAKIAATGLWSGILKIGLAFVSSLPAIWSFATAMFAAIGWIPLAIAGVIAAVVALWYYWDEFTQYITSTDWFKGLSEKISGVVGWFKEWAGWLGDIIDKFSIFSSGDNNLSVEQQLEDMRQRAPSAGQTTDSNRVATMPSYMISNNHNQQSTQSTQIGAVNFNTQNAPDAMAMNSYMAMVAP